MTIQKLRPTFTFTEERLKQLEQVVPEAFADGKIDWETLQEALGEELENGREEHFGFTWPGKREARKLASIPSNGTLAPCPGKGVNEDTTENIFIEGENLEVLKILQKSYAGKIKMIYIDPPYNTGNDFVYNDNFSDPLGAYLKYTNAIGELGEVLTTNSRADGRFHSNWLNMIYPRLVLAKQLLKDDGFLFVSIDDNEVHHLKLILNELFGEENFVAQLIIQTNKGGRDYLQIAKSHEYLLVYANSYESEINLIPKSDTSSFKFSDSQGPYELRELRNRNPKFSKINRPNLYYPFYINKDIVDSFGYSAVSLVPLDGYSIEIYPLNSEGGFSCWRWGKNLSSKNIELDSPQRSQVVSKQRRDGGWNVYEKNRKMSTRVKSIWDESEVRSERGTIIFGDLFGKSYFEHPKPIELIYKALSIGCLDNEIVLDFFAGSSSTAHAVLKYNFDKSQNIKFMMIQFPEIISDDHIAYLDGFKTISEISIERIVRAIKKIQISSKKGQNRDKPSLPFKEGLDTSSDLGFKAFSYIPSNLTTWKSEELSDSTQALQLFSDQTNNLKDDTLSEDLLIEILLLEGFPLTTKLAAQDSITTNTVYEATAPDFCDHKLFICLDEKLDPLTAEQLVLDRHDIFICLDSALNDELKVRLADRFNVHII